MDISTRYVSYLRLQVDKPEVIVHPAVHHIELLDKVVVEVVAQLGEDAMAAALPKLKLETRWITRLSRRVLKGVE